MTTHEKSVEAVARLTEALEDAERFDSVGCMVKCDDLRAAIAAMPAASEQRAVAWRCFHCGDTFTDEAAARLHFGRDERSEAACVIKAGAEGSLLKALRDAEYQADDAIQRMHDESTDAAKAYHQQRCRHNQALMAAEELGYERGLADGRSRARQIGERS